MSKIDPGDLPTEIGETVELPAASSDDENANETHLVILEDPEGSLTEKFRCKRCGVWFTSAVNFEYEECIPSPG